MKLNAVKISRKLWAKKGMFNFIDKLKKSMCKFDLNGIIIYNIYTYTVI